ncbi:MULTISPECIES: hypothetical protein [unclassified Borrelia]|uniref:hypothetical protein n=1 Tax=unclassified Borrelia TaxID=2649934 RepID=UPI001E304906|nr:MULTISPECIES: hypothetical protein [unclassified Borrelia]UGQ16682.1 hypothetical protein LSO06_05025 [Borrelia sp. RT5S]UGQ17840.1 hypothetical protein LSO05_05260 [Borrelia sp. RT1S]
MSVVKQIKNDESRRQVDTNTESNAETQRREVGIFVQELIDQSGYDADYLDAFLVDAGYLYDTEVTRHEFMSKLSEFQKEFC